MTYACPKCGRPLEPTGLVTVDGVDQPVYQCDECTELTDVFGEKMKLPFTFTVNARGQVFKADGSLPDV
jgi:hypothetical protein